MMSPLLVLGLLGFSLLLPIFDDFSNDDQEEETPDPLLPAETETPEEPFEPARTVQGTEGQDSLIAQSNERINAGAGDDALGLMNGATGVELNGQNGADSIDLSGPGNVANGGSGQDSIIVRGSNTANGGEGDDTISAAASDGDTVAILNGGGAEDLLQKIKGTEGSSIVINANGGNGDDILRTELQLQSDSAATFDTLTGGSGDDTFQLDLMAASDVVGFDEGLMTQVQITDFNPDEDAIVIQLDGLDPLPAASLEQSYNALTLSEAAGGAYTDVVLNVTAANNVQSFQSVRLFGVTGLQSGDIIVR